MIQICEDCPLPHIVEKTGKCFDCLGTEEEHTAICSCGILPVRGGNLYCDMCLANKEA